MDILEKYKNILITELNKSYSKEDLSNISFEFPRDTFQKYVKRCVGLPGEKVLIKEEHFREWPRESSASDCHAKGLL